MSLAVTDNGAVYRSYVTALDVQQWQCNVHTLCHYQDKARPLAENHKFFRPIGKGDYTGILVQCMVQENYNNIAAVWQKTSDMSSFLTEYVSIIDWIYKLKICK